MDTTASRFNPNNSEPQVSVIIPTCDRPAFLPGAITSVLEQTFQDFEIIVVDDSRRRQIIEGASEVSRALSAFDDLRIRLIVHEKNRGGSAARNTGIRNSRGRYIAFLDDDDEWLPEKLEMQVHRLEASPSRVGCSYTGYSIVNRADEAVTAVVRPTQQGDLSQELPRNNCIGGTSSMLLRRECFEKTGMFDETLPSFQDYDLWLRLSQSYHFDCISTPLMRYYIHPQKIWTNLDGLRKGMDLMLKKHGASRGLRRNWSNRYLSLGVQYCSSGELQKGRSAILHGMRLNPCEIRHYFNFGLSLFGADVFRKTKGLPIVAGASQNLRSLETKDSAR